MKKNFIRNLVLKTLSYAFIICALPYSYFLWHAKQGIDAYLISRNFDVKLDYSWLWINHEGEIYLEKVRLFKTPRKPIIKAPRVKITLPSIFDLLDSREQVVYKTYPLDIKLSVKNATTNRPELALNSFGIKYKKELLKYIFPRQCHQQEDLDNSVKLPNLVFDLSTAFKIEQSADIAKVSFKFKDSQFATVTGTFNINRLFETGANTTYLSDISAQFNELAWFQQNTQACMQKLALGRNEFTIFYTKFLQEQALKNHLLLNKQTANEVSDFFYSPLTAKFNLDIKDGTTYSQIDLNPISDFQTRAGISLTLNSNKVESFFDGDVITEIEETQDGQIGNSSSLKQPKQRTKGNRYISKNRKSLAGYLGSKIKIHLYNTQSHIGYLDAIERHQLILKKLEYKGKSILPFKYSDIKSIELLVAEN